MSQMVNFLCWDSHLHILWSHSSPHGPSWKVLGALILLWPELDVWASLVIVYNCEVNVPVHIGDSEDTCIRDKIHECVLDWSHKVCKVCSARFVVQGWVLVCWWCPGRSGLCGGRILGAAASISRVVSSCPCDMVVQIFPSAFRAFFSVFLLLFNLGMNGVGGGVGVTG